MYSRETKISVSVKHLLGITILTLFCLREQKKHALGALGRYYRYDILWKVTNSSYCIFINVAILSHFPGLVEFVKFSAAIRVASNSALLKIKNLLF